MIRRCEIPFRCTELSSLSVIGLVGVRNFWTVGHFALLRRKEIGKMAVHSSFVDDAVNELSVVDSDVKGEVANLAVSSPLDGLSRSLCESNGKECNVDRNGDTVYRISEGSSRKDGSLDGEPCLPFCGPVEPTLDDLDLSIPQVDCEFVAALVRYRNFRRAQFLRDRAKLKERIAALTEKVIPSIEETSRFPKLGGLGFWRSGLSEGSSLQKEASGAVRSATSPSETGVVIAPEVLTQLSPPERDLLNSTRPEYEDGFLLLDCRTVNEITSWGLIEGAKVLPSHEIFTAFHLPPDEFEESFGFRKPDPESIIICYCQYGPRSLMAAQILSWLGYLKVLHFRDGYYEWGKQYNLLLRRWMEHDKKSGNELGRMAAFRAALEMQRDIAPEFGKLPMLEAAAYRVDVSRSPGKIRVGDGLRAEAYSTLSSLTDGLPLLEAGLGDDSSGKAPDLLDEQHLPNFISQATGIDPESEFTLTAPLSINDAQEAALQHTTKEHIDPFSSK